MQVEEAKILLGFPPGSRPDPSQVKAAYREKVWESHPDRFPADQKLSAESRFKSLVCIPPNELEAHSENHGPYKNVDDIAFAYHLPRNYVLIISFDDSVSARDDKMSEQKPSCNGARGGYSRTGVYSRIVRTGVPRPHAGKGNPWLIGIPFLLIVLGTVGLGGFKVTRAYKQQKQAFPSHNPFLP